MPSVFAFERHRRSQYQVIVRVVDEGLASQVTGFAALGNDHDALVVNYRRAGDVFGRTHEFYPRQARGNKSFASR